MVKNKTGDILEATENLICHQEEWRDIKGYEGLYKISNSGKIKSYPRNGTVKKERIIKPCFDKYGYLQIVLKNKTSKCFRVHRLIALAFIPNINNLETINHIDGNKLNNTIDNLEWNSIEQNNNHAYKIGLNKRKSIIQFDLNGNLIKKWNSSREIERALGFLHSNILECCKGRYNQMNGFKWRFE